ncbi:phosphopentomutase [Labrys sp. WJW]|uniref:phosphopentomutase n=1 Tax=Labrys sp. WJW TaxID=1737983 RepID=UPI00082FEDFD|nr:phosphopentomutase [Labrys sp. WJW]OCC04303.1 phosphopentomutase [Labrys sp. WJW]
MGRALLLVMDSFGIGSADDAERYGDAGADTLGHIAEACAAGRAGENEHRTGPLRLPVLTSLGLGAAAQAATGTLPPGLEGGVAEGLWGYAAEISKGKDTPSGHWEIAGYPVSFDWGYFPREVPCFPPKLIAAIVKEAGLGGVLGQCHASGTQIIAELGAESIETGKPIFYTSTDSVLQIAAHEEAFGLERLLFLCEIARRHVDHLNIGRVIARPFVGDASGGFTRTANRRDYAVPPPADTLLDVAERAGRGIITIGKIGDIFAHRGTGEIVKGPSNDALIDRTLEAMGRLPDGGLLFANYVDFDTLYGHRRDIPGYAGALEQFDMRLPQILSRLAEDDLLIITADHGCDPSWMGTDHTREFVPVLARLGKRTGPIGRRDSFADMAASVAEHLRLDWQGAGKSFL